MPAKYQPDHSYLRHVNTKRVHLFTIIQILSTAILYVIKYIDTVAISFPILVKRRRKKSKISICFIFEDNFPIFSTQKQIKTDCCHVWHSKAPRLCVYAARALLARRHFAGQQFDSEAARLVAQRQNDEKLERNGNKSQAKNSPRQQQQLQKQSTAGRGKSNLRDEQTKQHK